MVIPGAIRKSVGIEAKAKLLVYGYGDVVVMKKLEVPDIRRTVEALWKKVDERITKYGELTQEEIDEIIHAYRKRKQLLTRKGR